MHEKYNQDITTIKVINIIKIRGVVTSYIAFASCSRLRLLAEINYTKVKNYRKLSALFL